MDLEEIKKDLQSAIEFIQAQEYQKAKSTIAYVILNADKLIKERKATIDIRCPTHKEPVTDLIYFECGCFTARSNLLIKCGSSNEWLKYDG